MTLAMSMTYAASALWPISRAGNPRRSSPPASKILVNLDHRGAVGADPLVGDGAGILIQIPHELFKAWAAGENVDLPEPGDYAVAMCFLPRDEATAETIIGQFEHFIRVEGQRLIGWRDVPIDTTGLGAAGWPRCR